MPSHLEYSKYLQRRSSLGAFYRKNILYPRISSLLCGSMLDVGCGIGDMLDFYDQSIGIDVNSHNIDCCESRGLKASLMPFDEIPFEDESFDSVLLDNVLEHIAEPSKLMTEIKRVLRRNGVLVIGVPGLKGQAADLDHKIYYNEATLEALADKSGFKVNRYIYAPLFRSKLLSRMLTQYCIYSQWQKLA
jgi:SAM-dependent methyltransferase